MKARPILAVCAALSLGVAAPGAGAVRVRGEATGLAQGVTLEPGSVKTLTIPAERGPIGPQYKLAVEQEGGEAYTLNLFRYDRTLYGAHVHLDADSGRWRHEITAFAADQDMPERHAYVELRGTGGSLYYLSHREIIEGSEEVTLIVRDKHTRLVLSRQRQCRNLDYTIKHEEGRLMFHRSISSVVSDGSVVSFTGTYFNWDKLDGPDPKRCPAHTCDLVAGAEGERRLESFER